MVSLLLAAVLALPASAQFHEKSFGDGGGYKHPDASVGDFFEKAPGIRDGAEAKRPEAPKPPADEKKEAPAALAKRPELPVADQKVARRKEDPKPATAVAAAEPAKAPAPAKLPSLWNGRLQPLPAEGKDDAASEDARRDYESRLLGAPAEPKRDALGDRPAEGATALATQSALPTEGALFVSLEIDAKEAGSLRDAVAGLGAAASFRPDARFDPSPVAGGGYRLTGWIPASRLGDAISRPGVKRVSVEPGQRPSSGAALEGEYLVGLRVADPAKPQDSIDAGVRDLAFKAGFKLKRVLGIETAPDGAAVAVVTGSIPVAKLSQAMGRPGVVKVAAAVMDVEETPAPAAKDAAGFARFVAARGLWLALLTALLLLPSVAEALKEGLSVFVPYR